MEPMEEERYLTAAFRFLSEVSYGGPVQHLRYPLPPGSGSLVFDTFQKCIGLVIPSYTPTPKEDGPKIVSAKDWKWEISTVAPHSRTTVELVPPKVFSLGTRYIPPGARRTKGRITTAADEFSEDVFHQPSRKVQSFRHLLPTMDGPSVSGDDSEEEYDPNFLDNPELRTGKHRTVINLVSFLGSINHFTKAGFLKRELNEKFRKLHPAVHSSLTLSQIRNLKTKLLNIGIEEGLELATVARSFTFLEKLIISRAVRKSNRKVVGGCCLLLATKATDSRTTDYNGLLSRLAAELSVAKRELIELEFGVLAGLHFRLQVPESQYGAHLSRILSQSDYSNLQEYLGERMHETWQLTCS